MIKEKEQLQLEFALASPLHSGVRHNELKIENSLVAIQACWREKKELIANIIVKTADHVMTRRCNIIDKSIIFEAPEKPRSLEKKYEEFISRNICEIEQLINKLCA